MTRYTVPAREPRISSAFKGREARWQAAWERLPPDWATGLAAFFAVLALVPFVAAVLP